MWSWLCSVAICIAMITDLGAAQGNRQQSSVLNLPFGPVKRIASWLSTPRLSDLQRVTHISMSSAGRAEYVIVRLHGHTDTAPVVCFNLRYRVSRTGAVRKLSQQVFPVTAKFCGGE